MVFGLLFVSVLGYKAFKSYNSIEQQKNQINLQYEAKITGIREEVSYLKNSNKAYMYKIRKLRDTYDIDYDDVEAEEEDGEFKLSELAESIYPKLPPSLAKLIDKEEFQNAIVKTVEKKPEIITTFIDKFLGKGSDHGSTSNSTPQLKEVYN